jgi:hypothetical protein
MKGQISIIEAITTILILIFSLTIFFPPFSYETGWDVADTLLKVRDVITTADRIGILYNISFDRSLLNNFLSKTVLENNTVFWYETKGTVKEKIVVACNCTDEEIYTLSNWTYGLEVNGRPVKFEFCPSYLGIVNPCYFGSDVLLIWGYRNLTNYAWLLNSYLNSENGIVEVSDLNATLLDPGTKQIFGLSNTTTTETSQFSDYDRFRVTHDCDEKPCNASDIIYQPWKYFYHIPVPISTTQLQPGNIPTEGSLPSPYCSNITNNSLKIQSYVYQVDSQNIEEPYAYSFWVCNFSSVYFDTDRNGTADLKVNIGDKFNLPNLYNQSENFTFLLSYIDKEKVGITFQPKYKFYDFIRYEFGYQIDPSKPGNGPPEHAVAAGLVNRWAKYYVIVPDDNDYNRVLIQAENTTETGGIIPGVILKSTPAYNTAWIANFTDGGVGDDERMLLISLLLFASKKRSSEITTTPVKRGYEVSYVNAVNRDMFDVYLFTLGLGYPF